MRKNYLSEVTTILRRLLGDGGGATAVEYGLIVALLVIVIITALHNVADQNTGMWAIVSSKITTATSAA